MINNLYALKGAFNKTLDKGIDILSNAKICESKAQNIAKFTQDMIMSDQEWKYMLEGFRKKYGIKVPNALKVYVDVTEDTLLITEYGLTYGNTVILSAGNARELNDLITSSAIKYDQALQDVINIAV